MLDAVQSQFEGKVGGGTEDAEEGSTRQGGGKWKGLTDGGRQIDTEKQGLALSRFYLTSFRLASEPHQTSVIIPCQLAWNGAAFCEG